MELQAILSSAEKYEARTPNSVATVADSPKSEQQTVPPNNNHGNLGEAGVNCLFLATAPEKRDSR